jgi:hypothetical protein
MRTVSQISVYVLAPSDNRVDVWLVAFRTISPTYLTSSDGTRFLPSRQDRLPAPNCLTNGLGCRIIEARPSGGRRERCGFPLPLTQLRHWHRQRGCGQRWLSIHRPPVASSAPLAVPASRWLTIRRRHSRVGGTQGCRCAGYRRAPGRDCHREHKIIMLAGASAEFPITTIRDLGAEFLQLRNQCRSICKRLTNFQAAEASW